MTRNTNLDIFLVSFQLRLPPTAHSVAQDLIAAAQCWALPDDLVPLHHGGVLSVGLVTRHLLVQLLSGTESEE